MGISCGLLFVSVAAADTPVKAAHQLGLVRAESVPWKRGPLWESSGDGRVALLGLPAWHVVLSDVRPFLNEAFTSRVSLLSKAGDVFCIVAESTSGGLGFELHANGTAVRRWLEVEGEVEVNEGTPLPEEAPGLFSGTADVTGERDFWHVISVAERLTGLSWSHVQGLASEVHRVARP